MLSSKHPRAGRFAQLFIASLLLLTLALSVIPTGAETAGRESACPEGQVLVNGECVEQGYDPPIDIIGQDDDRIDIDIDPGDLIQTPEPTETPVIDIDQPIDLPSPTPTFELPPDIIPAEEATGYITVHKYDCGADQTAYQKTLEALRASCGPMADVQFEAYNTKANGEVEALQVATTDNDGLAFFQFANPVTVTVGEGAPIGYGDPIAACGPVVGAQPILGNLQILPTKTTTLPFSGDQEFYCDWFNVAFSDSDETGTVAVQKYVCPAGVDAYTLNFEALVTDCPDPHEGVQFLLIEGNQSVLEGETASDGTLVFDTVPVGSYGLVESMAGEFGPPRVFCHTASTGTPDQAWIEHSVFDDLGIDIDIVANQTIACNWFNVPVEQTGTIDVYKYGCELDPGAGVLEDPALLENCASLDGIEFTLQGAATTSTKVTGDPDPGLVRWTDLPVGAYTVSETLPEGYGQASVYCDESIDDVPVDLLVAPISETSVDFALGANMTIRCVWINLPLEDGSITIYKHLCPSGYDIYADGVDPWLDCTGNANGIGFWLNDADYQQTGDLLDSAVTWDGLAPGSYVVSEDVPPGTKTVFVLKCEGNSAPMIQNYPVSIGSTFQLYVESGDDIVCHWYNVPKDDHSTITVVKYACSTKTFISQDYCQLYEGGAGFELSKHDNNSWSYVSSGATNASGVLVFGGLQNGIYQIDEIDGSWCHASADYTDEQGYLLVDNADVTVWVYNCGIVPPKPTPVKYPNTGVVPPATLPISALAPVVPAESAAILDWRQWAGALDSRLAAPFASSGKPAKITIESIGVSAPIESLEVVDGAFQEPTTAEQVAWYKDTAWLGEPGNLVMAGHLNYWGVPEGVFFALDQVEAGDLIEVTAENGAVYTYEVTTVQLLPTDPASLQQVTAETASESLTLITCGGEWDAASQSYLQRTVVQAERVG